MSVPLTSAMGCWSARTSEYTCWLKCDVVTNTPKWRCRSREMRRATSRTPTELVWV